MSLTSSGEKRLFEDLRAWAGAAISAAAVGHIKPENSSQCILEAVRRILEGVAFRCNARHSLLSLPQALLALIIEFAGYESSWALSQACSHLRICCLSTPLLWRAIRVPFDKSCSLPFPTPAFVKRAVIQAQRCCPEPLEVHEDLLIWYSAHEEATISLLEQTLPRLRNISFAFLRGDIWPQSDNRLLQILTKPAPAAEELTVDIQDDGFYPDLPGDLFDCSSGKLRTLSLRAVSLPPGPYPALSNLHLFRWFNLKLDIDSAAFNHILAIMPRLNTLYLSVRAFTWGETEADVVGFGAVALRNFALLTSHLPVFPDFLACLRRIGTSNFATGRLSEQQLSALVQQPLSVHLGISRSELVAHLASSSEPLIVGGPRLMPFVLSDNPDILQLSPVLFGSLTELSMLEFFWPPASCVFPTLPALRSLRVFLASCATYRRQEWPVSLPSGILTGWDLVVYDVPALEVIDIVHHPPTRTCRQNGPEGSYPPLASSSECSCAESLPIFLLDVYHFVATCLRMRHERCAQLNLLGIESVDHDPWAALQLLKSAADEVVISPIAVPTRFVLAEQEQLARRLICDQELFL